MVTAAARARVVTNVCMGVASVIGSLLPVLAAHAQTDPLVISEVAEVSWSRDRVLEGQQVRLVVRLTHPVSQEPSWEAPPFEGFFAERLPSEGGFMEHDAQGRAVRTTMFLRALFPARAGVIEVPSSSILLQDRRGGQWRVPVPPTRIRVDPFPSEGRPPEFRGLVGELSVRISTEQQRVARDGAAVISIDVLGTAYLSNLPPIDLAAALGPDVEIFPEPPIVARTLRQRELITRRHQVFALVPARAGALEIPALEIPYFDTTFSRYRVARSDPLTIRVDREAAVVSEAAAEVASEPAARTRSLHERSPDTSQRRVPAGWLVTGAVLVLGLAAAAVVRNRHGSVLSASPSSTDPAGSAGSGAVGTASDLRAAAVPPQRDPRAWLDEAERAPAPADVFFALRQAMRAMLARRHGPAALAWTTSDLEAADVDEEAVAVMRLLDGARFSAAQDPRLSIDACVDAVRRYLRA